MTVQNREKSTQEFVRVTLDGRAETFPSGVKLRDVVRRLIPEREGEILCALNGGECMELAQPIMRDCSLCALDYTHEEGRRVYERTLRFIFFLSMKRLYPQKRTRVLNSIGYGIYLQVVDEDMNHEMIGALESDMRELIRQNLPLEKEILSREAAIGYFAEQGWNDKAEILSYRPHSQFTVYRSGPLCEYFYGAMLPSTGYVHTFALKPHFPGLVLLAPAPKNPHVPAPYIARPKHLRVFMESRRWCSILGAENAADVNRMIREGNLREFIRVNEALHDRSIAHIADEILSRHARIVMVFGPSSSGKTTFAHRLGVQLRVLGKKPKLVSLDDFYRNRTDLPLEADGMPDLESIDALDIPLLSRCLEGLLAGETVMMPRFEFKEGSGRRAELGIPMRLAKDEILVVEGIHGLNDRITSEIPEQMMYGVYVSALPCINLDDHNRIRTTDVRLLRRIVRDMRFRGFSPIETINMWPKVRAGEEKWIFPNQEKADAMFNTSLHYELPVLKTMAYDLLFSIPQTMPEALVARRLLKFLQYFLPVDDRVFTEIPPLSILREFIGECSFYDRH